MRRCDPGWYGTDCSRKRAGLPIEPSSLPFKPWILTAVDPGTPAWAPRKAARGAAEGQPRAAGDSGAAAGAGANASQGVRGLKGLTAGSAATEDPSPLADLDGEATDAGSVGAEDEGAFALGRTKARRPPVAGGGRKRPLIYVYDLPPDYNSRLLQYKIDSRACSWRTFQVRICGSTDPRI